MEKTELRASLALAGIFALRMLGLFLILPVFSMHAKGLPGGDQALLVGLALGVYGLVQACLHIPLGMLSDRYGRRPVVVAGLLLFVLGAIIAGSQDDLMWIIVGRAIQGAGAVSAAVTAWLADLTKEETRTRAMAMVGGSIALTFAISLVLASPLHESIGLDGMFYLMAVLGVGAMLLALFVVPQQEKSSTPFTAKFSDVFFNADLLRLNFGVFALHAAQIALFLTLPRLLVKADLPLVSHWHLYLPAVLISFACMAPIIMMSERRKRMKPAFIFGILAMMVAQLMIASFDTLPALAAAVLIYFIGFNILEAMQPSLVSRWASQAKGTALGIYNTTQSIGLFIGGLGGGWLLQWGGESSVFYACAALIFAWLIIALSMRELPIKASSQT
jgi:predicted MFS family arabinose efflux permease